MAEDSIRIRILADASDLKSGTLEASAAVDQLGSRFETASVNMGRMETSMVHLSAHMVSHAAGMGRMGLMIARMGESAMGAAPLLAVLIPVAALVGGIEIMEKLEEATLKTKEAALEMAEGHAHAADELRRVQENIVGLTKGPLEEARKKEHDLGLEASNLSKIFKEDNKVMEENTHWWNTSLEAMDKFGEHMHKWFGTAHATIIDPHEFEALRVDIAAADLDVNSLKKSLEAVQSLRMRVQVSGGNEGVRQAELKTLAEDEAKIREQIALAEAKQHEAHLKTGKVQEEEAEKQRNRFDSARAAFLAAEEEKQKIIRAAAKEAAAEAEFWQKAQYKSDMDALETQVEANKREWAAAGKQIADTERDQQKALSLEIAAIRAGGGTASSKEDQEVAAYSRQMTVMEPLIAQQRQRMGLAADDEVEIEREKLEEMLNLQRSYELKIQAIRNDDLRRHQQSIAAASQMVSQGVGQWISGHETFGRMALQMWQHTAMAAISNMTRIMAAQALGHAYSVSLEEEKKIKDAKSAARSGWKWGMDLPFPLSLVMAPVLAAAGFAGAMAFEHGGLTGEGGLSVLHPREMVLPQHLSDFVQKAASASTGGTMDDRPHTFNYQPNINAIDANGMADALKAHGELMYKMVSQQLRNRSAV